MIFSGAFSAVPPDNRRRILLIAGLSLVTLAVNAGGMLIGLVAVLPQLLYFPVILSSYWNPRHGPVFSLLLAAIYLLMVVLLVPLSTMVFIEAVARMAILVLVGSIVALLSWNLARSEKQLQDIIEFLPDPLFAIDQNGTVIAWNRAVEEMTGIPKSAMLGRGEYEYSLAFYSDRRPMLAGLILENEADIEKKYPSVRKEFRRLVSESYLPHFHGGRGAHLRFSATALLDSRGNCIGAIESARDISDQVMTETALKNAGNRLNMLSGILRHDISRILAVLYGQLRFGVMKFSDPAVISFIEDIKESTSGLKHQIDISREFRDIGTSPPCWIPVQDAISDAAGQLDLKLSLRAWTERLEIFTDPHLPVVFFHILHNALKDSSGVRNVIITYQIRTNGCALIVEDDGTGILEGDKKGIFLEREDSYGRGLFLASELLSLTNITICETGVPGKGARFEILIPSEGYRVAGSYDKTRGYVDRSLRHVSQVLYPGHVIARELGPEEYALADEVWKDYHETRGDSHTDRIFAVFSGSLLVSLARCRRHAGGLEVDGIFTPEHERGKGYSRMAVRALVEACHNDILFMYAVRHLVAFYAGFGFEPVPESDLPAGVRERYTWAGGNLEGAEVLPMRRNAGKPF